MLHDSCFMQNMFPKWRENKLFTLLSAVFLSLVSLYLLFLAVKAGLSVLNFGLAPREAATIAVEGEGKLVAVPDLATIDLGVQTEKTAVSAAQKENTEKMNRITEALKKEGVKADDLQTTNYQIVPQYDYNEGRSKLRGYLVVQNLNVKVRDLNKLGRLLEIAGSLGANQVGGLNFTIDEPEKYNNEARAKAIVDAKEKAVVLAKSLGVRLGKIRTFNESVGGTPPPPIFYAKEAFGVGVGGDAPAPTIEKGSLEVVSRVTIIYEIK